MNENLREKSELWTGSEEPETHKMAYTGKWISREKNEWNLARKKRVTDSNKLRWLVILTLRSC